MDDSNHYSYAVYADPAMAERFDSMRFSGPIGRLIAETQEQQIAAFLAPVEGRRVLDVGTGTGRAAIALAKRGAIVTGVDASAEMLAVAERRAREARRERDVRARRRASARVRGSQLRLGGVPARADAHARLARVARRAVPRRGEPRGVRLSVALQRGGAPGRRPPRHARDQPRRRGLPRVLARRRVARAGRSGVPRRPASTGSSCCRSRCTSA